MTPPLRSLAKQLIDLEMYSHLSDIGDLLTAFHGGSWSRLGLEDQTFYLEKMQGTFHIRSMGETAVGDTPEYRFIVTRIDQELWVLRKKN